MIRGNRPASRHNPFVVTDDVSLSDLDSESHVWLAWPDAIDEPSRLDAYRALLSEAETARLERFHFDVHKKLFLVSHALVRTALSRYVDVQPEAWAFEESEFGRPEIATRCEAPALRFNLSHTDGLAAVVVSMERDCGVDVERLHRVKDLNGVAERVFTRTERADLRSRTGDDLEGRFTEYWTLKEAYMKARGLGFQLPPHTFGVRIATDVADRTRLDLAEDFEDDASSWQLSLQPIPGSDVASSARHEFRLAVALRHPVDAPHDVVVRSLLPRR